MSQPMMRSHDLELDLEARCARLRGRPLKLSKTEFNLLSELVAHRGDVRLRDHLLRTIWRDADGKRNDSLDVYIHTLRGKIEADPKRPQRIVTVRGLGYRFQS